MKKLLIVLMLALLPSLAVADWDYFGTSTNPLIQAYYTTLYANTIQPLIQRQRDGWEQPTNPCNRRDSIYGDRFLLTVRILAERELIMPLEVAQVIAGTSKWLLTFWLRGH